jgi:hypothetical protein
MSVTVSDGPFMMSVTVGDGPFIMSVTVGDGPFMMSVTSVTSRCQDICHVCDEPLLMCLSRL